MVYKPTNITGGLHPVRVSMFQDYLSTKWLIWTISHEWAILFLKLEWVSIGWLCKHVDFSQMFPRFFQYFSRFFQDVHQIFPRCFLDFSQIFPRFFLDFPRFVIEIHSFSWIFPARPPWALHRPGSLPRIGGGAGHGWPAAGALPRPKRTIFWREKWGFHQPNMKKSFRIEDFIWEIIIKMVDFIGFKRWFHTPIIQNLMIC